MPASFYTATYLAQPNDEHMHEPLKARFEKALEEHECLQSGASSSSAAPAKEHASLQSGASSSSAAPVIVVDDMDVEDTCPLFDRWALDDGALIRA